MALNIYTFLFGQDTTLSVCSAGVWPRALIGAFYGVFSHFTRARH